MNVINEIRELSIRLDTMAAEKYSDGDNKIGGILEKSAIWLEKLSHSICAGGIIGCSGGSKCTSDHK